jgi:hypothetical protein
MEDFIWLVDLRDLFKYKRHIIRLTPDMVTQEGEADVSQKVDEVGDSVMGKTQHLHTMMLRRVEEMEKNTRSLLKTQG